MFDASPSPGSTRWPVVRVGVGGTTRVVVCAERFLPLTTHWVTRTVLCAGEDCPLCEALAARGLFYLPVAWDERPAMLELSALASSHFEQHAKLLHGGIRPGLVVELSRRGRRSPVRAEVVAVRENVAAVPVLEFAPKVMALYSLPGPNPGETFAEYEQRLVRVVRIRAERSRRVYDGASSGRAPSRC